MRDAGSAAITAVASLLHSLKVNVRNITPDAPFPAQTFVVLVLPRHIPARPRSGSAAASSRCRLRCIALNMVAVSHNTDSIVFEVEPNFSGVSPLPQDP